MRKITLAILVFLLTPVSFVAADFTARILNCPKELPKGAPLLIRGQAQNISGHPIKIARGYEGFQIRFLIRRADGEPIKDCSRERIFPSSDYEFSTLANNEVKAQFDEICFGNVTGEFIIQMVVGSTDLFKRYCPRDVDAWVGEVRSEEIRVTVTEPVGIDAEAYKEFDGRPASGLGSVMSELWPASEGSKLLRCHEATRALFMKYSSSTYAAYALLAKVHSFRSTESKPTAAEIDMKRKYAHWLVNPSEGKGQYYFAASPDGVVQAELDAINAVLSSQSNFPFRFVFDYRGGLDYYMLHDYKNARSRLSRCLGEDVAEPIRSEAKVYLDVLDENKL